MKNKEFTTLLTRLRDAQRLYWRTRHSLHYREMISFEKLVDDEIIKRKKKEVQAITRQFEFEPTEPPPHGW